MTANNLPGRDALLELAARVEAAAGPDGELAKDIFRAVHPERVPTLGHPNDYGWREDESGWWLATGEDARIPPKRIDPLCWLSSLDAALLLVPDAFWIERLGEGGRGRFRAELIERTGDGAYGVCDSAASLPLALCSAALRALAEGPAK